MRIITNPQGHTAGFVKLLLPPRRNRHWQSRQLNTEDLWERKRQIIEQTPGLSVWRGGETFEDIGGVENVKSFLRAVLAGINPPRVIVFIDEIEKAFAGTALTSQG